MGCAPCKAAAEARARGYVYVDQNGAETKKSTEVEARAMMIRNDNQGEVRPA